MNVVFLCAILLWGVVYAGCGLGICPVYAAPFSITASSTEDLPYLPEYAYDGKQDTRWSSVFKDGEWIQFDFGKERLFTGLTLLWENAFAVSYEIHASSDEKKWKKVYEERYGDGHSDEVYVQPIHCRFVRLLCVKRGTAWGNSLYEVVFRTGSYPRIKQREGLVKKSDQCMDGDYESHASFSGGARSLMRIDLKKRQEVSGVECIWNDISSVLEYDVFVSYDGKKRDRITGDKPLRRIQTNRSDVIRDVISVSSQEVRYIDIECTLKSGGSAALAEVRLKHFDDMAGVPLARYQHMAHCAKRGYFPFWLTGEQEYWAITGVPYGDKEVAVSEMGRIENGYSVMPFIRIDGELLTYDEAKISHELEEGWMPIVRVKSAYERVCLSEEVFCYADRGEEACAVSFTLTNTSERPSEGVFYLTVRPFQVHPPWLYGGMASIHSLEYTARNELIVNRTNHVLWEPADQGGFLSSFKDGDPVFQCEADSGFLSASMQVTDSLQCASGAIRFPFHLSQGEASTWYVRLSMGGEVSEACGDVWYQERRKETIEMWKKKCERVSINVPDKTLSDVLKSSLVYTFLHMDEVRFQAGSRTYEKTWMRDGADTCAALLRMGYNDDVKRFLLWMKDRQYENGMIPFTLYKNDMPGYVKEWKEYDSQGEFIYAVAEYYRFTKDKSFLDEMFPAVHKAIDFMESVREGKELKGDAEKAILYEGILQASNSHEGYFPAQHSYWDNVWAMRGYRDALLIARECGRKEKEEEWDRLRDDFEGCVRQSVERAQQLYQIDYMPGCAEKGDFDPPATAQAVFPCAVDDMLPRAAVEKTWQKFYTEVFPDRKKPEWRGTCTSYEARMAFPFLMNGEREKAYEIMTTYLIRMYPHPWRLWGETIFGNLREPQYIGDLPHGWVSVIWINLIRSMMVYEKEDQIVLGAGVPAEWFEKGFSVANMPTWFGVISYEVKPEKDGFTLSVSGDAHPALGLVFRLPAIYDDAQYAVRSLPHTSYHRKK